MKNYIIPYSLRSTMVSNGIQRKFMVVDNVGLMVGYKTGDDHLLTPENIRKHLIGFNDQHSVIIQAEDLQSALLEFHDWEGCKTGTKYKAIEIADKKNNPVIEYSGCPHMVINGFIRCAMYDENEHDRQNTSLCCVLDGMDDPPSDCIIDEQQSLKKWRSETVQIGGVWVKKYDRNVRKMTPIIPGNRLMKKAKYNGNV